MSAAAYKVEHVAAKPRGYKVRSVTRGSHVVRIGFPTGSRKKGSGKVLEILHPKSEHNPNGKCIVSARAKTNPGELLIFGNPSTREKQKAARERAERIRRARLNPKKQIAKRATPRRRRADRNPSETKEAVRLFQGFHGHDPQGVVEKQISAAVRLDYTALGDFLYVKTTTPLGQKVPWDFRGDGVKLASSPDGKQLYCIGGNQNVLPLLDDASKEKDFIDLGEAYEVAYEARKVHGDFRPVEYYHEFGEINGSRPRLMFDKLRKQLFFIGGDYFIHITERVPGTPLGKVSPGIEN